MIETKNSKGEKRWNQVSGENAAKIASGIV